MIKKVLISTVTLLFLVSTTGLPVTISLCNMNAEDMDQCTMHNKPVKSMCCIKKTSEKVLRISSATPNCCQVSFVYNKVEDEFVNNKTDKNFYDSLISVLVQVSILPESSDLNYSKSFYTDSSPPFLIDPEIHITNSSLLI